MNNIDQARANMREGAGWIKGGYVGAKTTEDGTFKAYCMAGALASTIKQDELRGETVSVPLGDGQELPTVCPAFGKYSGTTVIQVRSHEVIAITDVIVEEYPDFGLNVDRSLGARLQLIYGFNDHTTRTWDECDRVMDKAARRLDEVIS